MSIVWLASYPKSGNTWLRAVLTNYLRDDGEPASINALAGEPVVSDRETFSEIVGLDSSDMTPDEILRHRPLFHELLAGELARRRASPAQSTEAPSRERAPAFVKVHDAYIHAGDSAPLFPKVATSAVVYLVRNPLDVAVSYAHHRQKPIDDTVRQMNNPAAVEGKVAGGIHVQLPQLLTTWSGHVVSWLDQEELPVHVVRYEDLLADPMAGFGAIVRFAGFRRDEPSARLARAIDHAAFSRLRAQEEDSGFSEKQPTAPSFFRAGVVGSWRTALTSRQVQALVDAHGTVMARFGYLREAEAFLASDAEPHADERTGDGRRCWRQNDDATQHRQAPGRRASAIERNRRSPTHANSNPCMSASHGILGCRRTHVQRGRGPAFKLSC